MINCYILARKKWPDIYLDPYLQEEKVDEWDPDDKVFLFGSGTLTKQQKDEASYSFYSSIDFAVDRWIQDKQYVPRLLVSALVFLVAYFILSLAIRDPIPMVDELVISTVLTVACWHFLAKRDTRSSIAVKRRYELKQSAGSPTFLQKEGMEVLEAFLDEVSHLDSLDLCQMLCLERGDLLPPISLEGDTSWAEEMTSLLMLQIKTYNKNLFRVFKKVEGVRKNHFGGSQLSARLFHMSMQQKLDLGLLSLMVALSENFG